MTLNASQKSMRWYWSDWRSDPRLRMCGLAARGLWAEMIALMHEADPYGHLLVSGRSPTDTQLAVLAGAPPEQIPDLLGELESAGVFSRTSKGVIYSRRMTRDDKKARQAVKHGKTGGNPSLRKQSEISTRDNPHLNPPHKGRDNTHIPVSSIQYPESPPPATSPVAARGGGDGLGKPDETPAQQIAMAFIAIRQRCWPHESAMPSPLMDLRARAKEHLDNGGTIDLIIDVIRRGMERHAEKGKTAPTSIAFFRNSIIDAIAAQRSRPYLVSSGNQGSIVETEEELWARRVDGFRKRGFWFEGWGPNPDEPGFRRAV